ncbi:MAG: peptide deformylase [Oligoflexia bacterium]|nr:peptide deformylase [Oligoflexia bacterium]
MAILEILTYPDTRLAKKSEPVTEFDTSLETFCNDMLETMYDAPGVGLAAPQVNVHKRIVVIDIEYESSDDEPPVLSNKNPLVFINAQITKRDGKILFKEGCLSVPGEYEEVERSEKIEVEYQDTKGNKHTLQAEGYLAVAIQHELDHLEGKLFIDRLSFLKSKRIKKKIKKEKTL